MGIPKISTGALVALVTTGILLTLVTSGAILSTQQIPSSGTITAVNVGVYTDSACTTNCTSISWGTIAPGNTTTRTVYVKNTGNVPVTLSMATSGWNPTAANGPITLSWNCTGTVLNAGQVAAATLTLSVSSSISSSITSFSFNIAITGTG
ncbi:MAG: hypothetical protein NWE99_10610 [Candidatus Bathyarchaeota archaeon]|nr:hypothetical protein [Candidatus Bathyarchaeota archaeon]